MESAKVFIDTDNEITFILEKILTAKSDKVCLVVPDRASLFTSVSGLKLIKRVIDKSSKLLVMVTLDENGADLAKRSGLMVVSRVGEITNELWEDAQKSKFEFVKKSKNRVYYQPEKTENLQIEDKESVISTENNTISIKELIDSKKVIEEIPSQEPVSIPEETIQETVEVPQIRIKVDNDDIKEAQAKDYEEISIPNQTINDFGLNQNVVSKNDLSQNLENLLENDKKSMSRMRKTAENPNSLSFTFGKDINPQKKKVAGFSPSGLSLTDVKERFSKKISDIKDNSGDLFNSIKEKIRELPQKNSFNTSSRPRARSISKSLEFGVSNPRQMPATARNPVAITPFLKNNSTSKNQNFQSKLLQNIQNIKLSGNKKTWFYIGALVIVPLLVLSVGAYSFFSFTSLYTTTITYEFRNVSASRTIEASTEGTDGFSVTKLEETDAVSANKPVTGEKIIGERAKGSITIFNATTQPIALKKGAVLTCVSAECNGLTYALDSDANIAFGDTSNATIFDITAGDIGENYNQSLGRKFKIGRFDPNNELVVRNISNLSGGTPKNTIKIASATDIKAVEEQALNDLKVILLNKIKANSTNSSRYIFSDTSLVVEKISAETDKEGTEADVINTNVRAKATLDAFPRIQIDNVIDEIKSTLAPSGYLLDDKLLNSSSKIISSSPGKITLEVVVSAVARPEINTDQIKKQISGKSLGEANEIISAIPNIKSHESEYSPSIMPQFLRRVPGSLERVQIRLIAVPPST